MAIAASLRAVLGLDDAEFRRGLKESERASASTARELEAQFKKAGAAIGAAVAAGVTAIGVALSNAIEKADEFTKLAQKVGVSVEALSGLGLAAELSGVNVGKLQDALTRLNRGVAEAAGGGELAAKKFDALGVSIRNQDGSLRSTESVFADLADRFASFEDGPAKAALAVQLFGRSGADLLPLLNAGSKGLADATEKAAKLGVVISEETGKKSELFNDSLLILRRSVDGFGNTLAEGVLPALAGFASGAADAAVEGGGLTGAAKAIAEEFRAFLRDLVTIQTEIQILGAEIANAIEFLSDWGSSFSVLGQIAVVAFESIGAAASGNLALAQRGLLAIDKALAGVGIKAAADAAERAAVLRESIAQIQADAAKKIAAINGELAQSGATADDAARKLRKVPAPVIDLTNATTKLGKATESTADGLKKAAAAADRWRASADQLADSIQAADVDRQAAAFVQLSLAIEDAFARGDADAVERYTAALLKLGEQMDEVAAETRKAAGELDEFERINKQAAENFASIWEGVTRDVASAFADLFSGAGGGIEGFLQSLANANQRRVGDTLDNAFNAGFDAFRAEGGGTQQAIDAFSQAGGFAAIGQGLAQQAGTYIGGGGARAAVGAQIGGLIGSIFGPIGSIVGSILGGALGGLFDEKPRIQVAGSAGLISGRVEATGRSPFGTVAVRTSGDDSPAARAVLSAVQRFDQAIAQVSDTLPGQTRRITDALARFDADVKGSAATVEEILTQRFGVILGTFEQRVQDYVNQVSGVEEQTGRLARAVELLNAAAEGLFPEGLGTGVENAALQVQRTTQRAGRALEELGFSADTSAAELEAAFNRGEGLTIEQIEAYFETAEAVREATAAVRAYEEAVEGQRRAVQNYNDFIAGFREEAFGLNDFQRGIRGIARATRDATDQANRLARAAGLQAAREEDLAVIQIASARRVAAAVRELENASRGIVAQLYPAAAAADALAGAGQQAANAISNVATDLNDATRGLRDFADDLLIGENSPLQGRDRLAEALRQLEEASARGDAGRVQQLATQTLGIGRDVFASGADFAELFRRVEEIVRGTVAVDTNPGGPSGGDFGAAVEAPALTAAQRFELAQDLAQNVADIASVTGESVGEIAERLGFSVDALAEDLGISIDELIRLIAKLQPDPAADRQALDENFGQLEEALNLQTGAIVEATEEVVDAVNENGEEQREIDRQNGERLGDIVRKLDSLIEVVRSSSGGRSSRPSVEAF